ncbi:MULTISPECIES: YkgB family protein [unclassified Nonomuraea]|uniref:YkgB family protein n=1 Tax=unclassified Nonomuraea TaxID=2593643 RepID=UPI0035C2227A
MRMQFIATKNIHTVGRSVIRSALALNLVWIGRLKFEDYEVENIRPLVASSPLFSLLVDKLGEKQLARLIGVTEIAMGSLIAVQPLNPRASVLGSLGAVAMFAGTLSFLATTPGVWQENHGAPKLSMVGQFLVKDSVLLGASLVTLAESLQAAQRR